MVLQLCRVRGLAVQGQIGRGSHGEQATRPKLAKDVAGLQVGGDADGQVNAFFDQVGALVREVEQQLDVRLRIGKVQQGGHQALQAKAQRQRQADAAPGYGFFLGQAGFGGVHHIQDHAALFQIGRSCGGERQAARAAGDQLDHQVLFQRGDLARHHRACHVQLVCHGGKAAGLRYAHKGLHGVELVHCC